MENPTTRELLIRIDNLASKVGDLTTEVKSLNISVVELKLNSAHKTGYEQGESFWFKAGWGAALTATTGGFLLMFSLLTGKVNISDLFK